MDDVLDRTVPLHEVASGRDIEQHVAVGLSSDCEPFVAVEDCVSAAWSPAVEQLAPRTVHHWVRSVSSRAVVYRTGSGARQAQRRVKAWTGQS